MISPSCGLPPRRRSDGAKQIVLAHQAEHQRLRAPGWSRQRKPSRPCGSPRPPRAMPPGRSASIATSKCAGRDRGLRIDALPAMCSACWPRNGVERGAGQGDAARPGRRPDPCFGEVAALIVDLRRPRGPKVSVLASSSSTSMVHLSDPLHGADPAACTGSPRLLERGVDPADRYSQRHCSSRKLYAQLARQKPARHAKAAERPHVARHRFHRWPSPSGPAGKAGLGKTCDEPSSPAFTTGPCNATFFQNYRSGSGPPCDTSIKPIRVQGNRVRLTTSCIFASQITDSR